MPDIEEIIRLHRARLLRRESSMMIDLASFLDSAIETAMARAERALGVAELRVQRGESPVPALVTYGRLQVLLDQLQTTMANALARSAQVIERGIRVAEVEAARYLTDLGRELQVLVGIDPEAIARAASAVQVGSPVERLLADVSLETLDAARTALVKGVALGDNPRVIARDLRRAMNVSKRRAETIARTETLRAYRGAVSSRMRDIPGITGQVWVSAKDRRTCAMCWAMDGQVFPLGTPMGTHPNCRCSWAPIGKYSALKFPTGVEVFERLRPASQAAILGPAKYRAYEAGRIELPDLVARRRDPVWGEVRSEASLISILGPEAVRFYATSN